MAQGQTELFPHSFETARPATPVYCHQDFLEKLDKHRFQPLAKRASLLLQRLAVDSSRQHFKATHGPNRGWRRSRLGGSGGSHFYAWWAPASALPLKDSPGFEAAPTGAIVVRDIRHHDDHSTATPQSLDDHYLLLSVADIRSEEYGPSPWTPQQVKFSAARENVRFLKGHPGSGKTTALLHAADQAGTGRVLYVTYSTDLAALARGYFDRYCSKEKQFHVATFPSLIRQLLRSAAPLDPEAGQRKRFQAALVPFARTLGVWNDRTDSLWEELHAHVAGGALPVEIGRFAASDSPRTPDRNYRQRRARFLGLDAANLALDAAQRLERADPSKPLAERFFPELYLAWQAATKLLSKDPAGAGIAPEFLDFDCIAVDECQDLTPIESFVLIRLAAVAGARYRNGIPLLLAGDEAQTVRPTDFEWGWLSDLAHSQLASPTEFRLASNLRSPRRIAGLVNHVWDLYEQLDKRDRPSGSGYAAIDDDATDQVLFCTGARGPELNELLKNLADREGLAMIAMDDKAASEVPPEVRHAVLTPADAKGLDFHSVCLLNPGRLLERIHNIGDRFKSGEEVESLRRRLAIDQLRVAISRPTERLFWLDLDPTQRTVQESLDFLNDGVTIAGGAAVSVPAAILRVLDEEQLGTEERIQRCLNDARQLLMVKPDLAWSRAHLAVTLLGEPENVAGIEDQSLRRTVQLTLAEISFALGFRRVRMSAQLGNTDMFLAANRAAHAANRPGLARIIDDIARVLNASFDARLLPLSDLAQTFSRDKDQVEPWLLVEIGTAVPLWLDELEGALGAGNNAAVLSTILPPFYEALRLPDAAARKQKLRKRSVQILIKNKRYSDALILMRRFGEHDPKLEVTCHEGLNDWPNAAEAYRELGDLKEALRCYRMVPDYAKSVELLKQLPDHPAAESFAWLGKLEKLVAQRPEKFNKVMTAPERKVLEGMLERALGVVRKKPAPRKAPAVKKAAAPRKRTSATEPRA